MSNMYLLAISNVITEGRGSLVLKWGVAPPSHSEKHREVPRSLPATVDSKSEPISIFHPLPQRLAQGWVDNKMT